MSRTRRGVRPLFLPIAIRAYVPAHRPRGKGPVDEDPSAVLVLDTETTIDQAQRLTFGSYRVHDRDGVLRQEGIFYDDELAQEKVAILLRYREGHADD